jgi:hypothetical protein
MDGQSDDGRWMTFRDRQGPWDQQALSRRLGAPTWLAASA